MNAVLEEELLSTSEAAKVLGVSKSTIYRMVEQGTLDSIKTPGGQRRFDVRNINLYKVKSKSFVAPQNPYKEKIESAETIKTTEISEPSINEEGNAKIDNRNKLNDLTGKEWLPATKSFFYQKGLGASHPHAKIERMHPAPYSYQDVGQLISFFTKQNAEVLDPFGGVGSTAKACALLERVCTSIELSENWHSLAIERLEKEVNIGESQKHKFINGDSREKLKSLKENSFDFVVTSPPYWAILNKKADHKVKKERLDNNLATNYSNAENDLGNIADYKTFLDILCDDIFTDCAKLLKESKYMALVVSDFRNKSEFISFHSDIIQKLNQKKIDEKYKLSLQGVKVLLQNHKSLLPYGYPFAYVENIHHQYILIFRKEKVKK